MYVLLFLWEFCLFFFFVLLNVNRFGDWINYIIFIVRNSGYIVFFMLYVLYVFLFILKYIYIYNIIIMLKDV